MSKQVAVSKADEYLSQWSTFEKSVVNNLCKCLQSLNSMPQNSQDYDDYCALFPSFKNTMKIYDKRIQQLITKILQHSSVRSNIFNNDSLTDISDSLERLINVNDVFLERVNDSFDVECGITKPDGVFSLNDYKSTSSITIERPQLSFSERIDNSRDAVFSPALEIKHNSQIDLDQSTHAHPYYYELSQFKIPDNQKTPSPTKCPVYDQDKIIMITRPAQLHDLIALLSTQQEFAVDLEYHSYRSFYGFTCLIQISTRSDDFIIDAISLRDHVIHLNKVFTDPKILKVFHGSDSDIMWLQKDFSVYVVNMFDTGQAARVMSFPRYSLAYLMSRFVQIIPNKKYQLADWRMRPLPSEMVKYASQDTHYLLYIYDLMKNQLISNNQLNSVYQRSTEICMRVFSIKSFSKGDCRKLVNPSMNPRQRYSLMMLYDWRDSLARSEDESPEYVMSSNLLVHLAVKMPKDVETLFSCCSPMPPLVKTRQEEVLSCCVAALAMGEKEINSVLNNLFICDKSVSMTGMMQPTLPFIKLHDFAGSDSNWSKDESQIEVKHVPLLFGDQDYRRDVFDSVVEGMTCRIDCQLSKGMDSVQLNRTRIYHFYSRGTPRDVMGSHCLWQSFCTWKFKPFTVQDVETPVKVEEKPKEELLIQSYSSGTTTQTFFPFSGKRKKDYHVETFGSKKLLLRKDECTTKPYDYKNKIKELSKVKSSSVSKVRTKDKPIFKKFKKKKIYGKKKL